MAELEQHHIRYEEIHGEDEIILLSHEEHLKVHREDHANGFKPIPDWIVRAAQDRSPVGKVAHKRHRQTEGYRHTRIAYEQSDVGKVAREQYKQSDKGKATRIAYDQSEEGKAINRVASAKYRAKMKAIKDGE